MKNDKINDKILLAVSFFIFTDLKYVPYIYIQPLRGCGAPFVPPQVSPGAIYIQPLRGWGSSPALPQVFLKAIISRSELLRFTFNPYGVGAPRFRLGLLSRAASYCVSHSTPLGLWPLGFP